MKVVIVGNGPGGVELAKRLAKEHDVTIVEREETPYYVKPMMSHYVAGDADESQLFPYSLDWYRKNRIELLLKTEARRIDAENRTIHTDAGALSFDVLVLATGARARKITVPGAENMLTLRTWQDAKRLKERLEKGKELLIVGAGFIGLELAGNLAKKGYRIRVVEKTSYLLNLEKELTERIKERLESYGVEFFLGRDIERIEKDVLVTDKEEIPARLILCAIGIVPEIELAKESGAKVNRGVLVDKKFRTSLPNVYAIGDCAEFEGIISGTAKAAMDQAKVLANILSGLSDEFDFQFRSSYFKFADLPLAILGRIEGEPRWIDEHTRAFYKDDRIVGVVVLEDTKQARAWEERLRKNSG